MLSAPLAAQDRSVTIAWDPSPDASVVGYIVYVGNESGSPSGSYDAGDHTSFVYPNASGDRPYFFSVAAYTAGALVGSRSEEVSLFSDAEPGPESNGILSRAYTAPRIALRAVAPAAATVSKSVCLGASGTDCYVVDRLVAQAGEVSTLASLGDGRLLFIEDHARVRIIAEDTLIPEEALRVKNSATQLSGLAVDPAFSSTRFVYVSEVERLPGGRRELSVVRYRELHDTLGEAAAIVTGLRLPSSGDAEIALDATRHLFVAIPTFDGERTDAHGGMVLRFKTDGTVPDDNRAASPIFARGYAHPAAIQWNAIGNELWLTGSDTDDSARLARLPLDGESTEWPRVPRAVSRGPSPGRLLLIRQATSNALITLQLPADAFGGEPLAAVVGNQGELHVVIRVANAQSASPASQIVRLRGRRAP